jgi:ABC-type antimicrobial peptide transport system permease subunit
MALGANRLDVLRMMLRDALMQTGTGLIIGIPAAILIGHLMTSQLFGIHTYDSFLLGA